MRSIGVSLVVSRCTSTVVSVWAGAGSVELGRSMSLENSEPNSRPVISTYFIVLFKSPECAVGNLSLDSNSEGMRNVWWRSSTKFQPKGATLRWNPIASNLPRSSDQVIYSPFWLHGSLENVHFVHWLPWFYKGNGSISKWWGANQLYV